MSSQLHVLSLFYHCMTSRFGATSEDRNFPKGFQAIFTKRYIILCVLSMYFEYGSVSMFTCKDYSAKLRYTGTTRYLNYYYNCSSAKPQRMRSQNRAAAFNNEKYPAEQMRV